MTTLNDDLDHELSEEDELWNEFDALRSTVPWEAEAALSYNDEGWFGYQARRARLDELRTLLMARGLLEAPAPLPRPETGEGIPWPSRLPDHWADDADMPF